MVITTRLIVGGPPRKSKRKTGGIEFVVDVVYKSNLLCAACGRNKLSHEYVFRNEKDEIVFCHIMNGDVIRTSFKDIGKYGHKDSMADKDRGGDKGG